MADRRKEQEEQRRLQREAEKERRKKLARDMKAKRKQALLLRKKQKRLKMLKLKKLRDAKLPKKSVMLSILKFVFRRKKSQVPGYYKPDKEAAAAKSDVGMSTAQRIKMQNEEWLKKFGHLPGAENPFEKARQKDGEGVAKPRDPTISPF